MSSSLNHYTADVQVTDAVMHNKTPLSTSTFTVAVLAANVTDAKALIQEFYGRTGMSSKIINGIHTLYRAATPNVPGAIRTVTVTNVVLVTSPTAAVPVAASTSAPATAAAAACCRRRDSGCCRRGRRNTSSCSSASCFNSYQHCDGCRHDGDRICHRCDCFACSHHGRHRHNDSYCCRHGSCHSHSDTRRQVDEGGRPSQ